MDKLLQVIVTQYQAALAEGNGHVELELRWGGLDSEDFIALYNKMKGKEATIEHTINIISDDNSRDHTKLIRTLHIVNGEVTKDIYSRKRRYKAPMSFPGDMKMRAGISIESPASKFTSMTNAMVRFKNRISWNLGRWRLDMTAVQQHTLSQISSRMKEIRDAMFPLGTTPDNYIDLLPDSATSYEVELEFIGANLVPDDFTVALGLLGGESDTGGYQAAVRLVADMLYPPDVAAAFSHKSHRLKQLANQVLSLSRNQYYSELWPPTGYLVTDKADGLRTIVVCEGEDARFILSDKLLTFKLAAGGLPAKRTVVDAELLGDRIFLFDVMAIDGKNISNLPMKERISHLDSAVSVLKFYETNIVPSAKAYTALGEDLEAGYRGVWTAPRDYEIDGLIISSPDDSYLETRNYKWKPMEQNTIDFLAIKCPSTLLGIKPYNVKEGQTLYLLFVGIARNVMAKIGLSFVKRYKSVFPITDSSYFPVQFSPSADPYAYLFYSPRDDLDRKIVELVRESHVNTAEVAEAAVPAGSSMMPGEWKLVKVREDRKMEANYFGNDFRVAEITYMNYVDPFYFEDLWKSQNTYFRGVASTMYEASNKFKRYVISVLMKENYSGARRVIDLAAGRGADLHRLMELDVKESIFVDIDPTAISELIRRKFSFFKQRTTHRRRLGGYQGRYDENFSAAESMVVHAMIADLKTPYATTVARLHDFGVVPASCDGAICNFAFHYMCDTAEHITNFVQLASTLLCKDGVLMITVMDGQRVFDLLGDLKTGEQWTAMHGERPQYAIKKKYDGAKLAKYGQTISVLLPFSDEMYDEPLCNVENLVAVAKKYHLNLEVSLPFGDYLEQFGKADSSLFGRLTDVDKHYIGLHQALTFRKMK